METSYTIEDKELLQRVGERIRNFRIEAGLSQEKLSFECDLDRTYIGSVERGERNIAVINLNKLAKALNISISELLEIEA
jgi:transcriptional regulator with XRE-family HTH domain